MWRSGSETSTTYAENLHLWVPTVMQPVCYALDILQGEHAVGMGFLLPTINIVLKQLNDFHQRNQNSLLLCELLANALIDGINRRFEHLREKHDVQSACWCRQSVRWQAVHRVTINSGFSDENHWGSMKSSSAQSSITQWVSHMIGQYWIWNYGVLYISKYCFQLLQYFSPKRIAIPHAILNMQPVLQYLLQY